MEEIKIMISGARGVGKTTLACYLRKLLEKENLNVELISPDKKLATLLDRRRYVEEYNSDLKNKKIIIEELM